MHVGYHILFLRNPCANMRMYDVSGDNHFQNSANLELVFFISSKPNEKTEMARNLDRISSQVKSLSGRTHRRGCHWM